jgi:hypothetical protein
MFCTSSSLLLLLMVLLLLLSTLTLLNVLSVLPSSEAVGGVALDARLPLTFLSFLDLSITPIPLNRFATTTTMTMTMTMTTTTTTTTTEHTNRRVRCGVQVLSVECKTTLERDWSVLSTPRTRSCPIDRCQWSLH